MSTEGTYLVVLALWCRMALPAWLCQLCQLVDDRECRQEIIVAKIVAAGNEHGNCGRRGRL